jgi:hypothetical protein
MTWAEGFHRGCVGVLWGSVKIALHVLFCKTGAEYFHRLQ